MLCAVYVRVSTREQTATPERQRDACLGLCREKGWEPIGVYEDLGVSGFKDPLQRPGFRRAVEELEERGGGVIVAWSIDRVTRRGVKTFMDLLVSLAQRNISVYTVLEAPIFDAAAAATGPLAQAMLEERLIFAWLERELVRQRTKLAMQNPAVRRRMEEGIRRFYEEVLGVRRPERSDEEKVVELYRRGYSMRMIARETGLSYRMVRKILVKHGLVRVEPGVCPRCGARMQLVEGLPPRYYCPGCGYEEPIRNRRDR